MPKVDVIVPAYNAAHFLPFALDSVVAQTFTDWRILLIDDGSQDNTPEIVRPYQEQLGDKLLYVRQPNAGLPAARNTAIRHATAELLALLDADDIWLPNRLELSVAAFEGRPHIGLSHGYVTRIDPNNRLLDTFATRSRFSEGNIATYIYTRRLNVPCPTVTFRRSAVEQVGNFDEELRATEDRDLWLRIAQRYEVALVPEIIAYYRVSPNAMTTNPDRMLQAQLQFVHKHYGTPGCGWLARRIALSWNYRQHAEALVGQGKYTQATTSALRAIAYFPFDFRNLRAALSLLLRSLGVKGRQPSRSAV